MFSIQLRAQAVPYRQRQPSSPCRAACGLTSELLQGGRGMKRQQGLRLSLSRSGAYPHHRNC
uniref:Uncharacterized protein n=1 Tax=uncultured marine virus TaxID=186617 RepID=A0A0F7L5R7_9VIRU|nr:hypothetical protein [uncultured marine virus]